MSAFNITQVTGNVNVVNQDGTCLGYAKINSLATATALSALTTIPVGTTYCLIQCDGADVRWRGDNVAPTATDGMLLAMYSERVFTMDFTHLRFIQVSAGAILYVSFFKQ